MTNDDDTDLAEALRALAHAAERATKRINHVARKRGWTDADAMVEGLESRELALRVEEGIYERADLEAPNGATFRLRDVYYWSQHSDGDRLVDVPEEQLPDGVAIEECRLTRDKRKPWASACLVSTARSGAIPRRVPTTRTLRRG